VIEKRTVAAPHNFVRRFEGGAEVRIFPLRIARAKIFKDGADPREPLFHTDASAEDGADGIFDADGFGFVGEFSEGAGEFGAESGQLAIVLAAAAADSRIAPLKAFSFQATERAQSLLMSRGPHRHTILQA
jgi:hypothetical protein